MAKQAVINEPTSDPAEIDDTSVQYELNQLQLAGYEFTSKIGEGGMAAVYKGRQLSLARSVAIKVLNQHMQRHDQVSQSFEREAVIIARLNHPNIIHVIDRGVLESGAPFFIMEYVDGVDLATLMREGQLPLQKKIEVCLQICKALSYAHKNSVIHRDVKPANVLVDNEFNIKVLDFGIALLFKKEEVLEGDGDESGSINDGSERDIMGTFNYMAPELQNSVTTATVRSDIYSLGVLMYELFAGHLPNREQRLKKPSETGLPETIANLIMSCLADNPHDRPRSMIGIHDRLLQLLRGTHLNKSQVQRANETFKRKSFSLLDVISETPQRAEYVFIEQNSGQQFVVKKFTGRFDGFATAQQLAHISHPNIARVHGASKNQRTSIVVMDYIKGGNLLERLLQTFALPDFLRLATQMCKGLAQAHSQQILHGNLRPESILFDENDNIKIADFAIKPLVDAEDTQDLSSKKQKITPKNYRLLKEPVCPQSDIYALGIIFHLMLIGNLPRYNNLEFQPGRAFKRLPETLQEIIQRMIKHHLVDRPQQVQDVLQVLNQFTIDQPTQVWDTNAKNSVAKNKKQRLTFQRILILLFVVLVASGLVAYLTVSPETMSMWWQQIMSYF